jgi:hypothetical protein
MSIIKQGYVWSEKKRRWTKLPRRAWLLIQRDRLLKIAAKKDRQK